MEIKIIEKRQNINEVPYLIHYRCGYIEGFLDWAVEIKREKL
jgi:hypothetical protein